MATHEELRESLTTFTDTYNGNSRLKVMNRDWDRLVEIRATDVDSLHTLIVKEGALSYREGAPPQNPDLTIISDSEILADVFYGDLNPIAPYNDGTLRIMGSEDDITRLDFIILMLWGE